MLQKAEIDEMENYVGKKIYQRWLWHAIDHRTGTNARFCVRKKTRQRCFLSLKNYSNHLELRSFYTDKLKTYERHLSKEERTISKYKMHLY